MGGGRGSREESQEEKEREEGAGKGGRRRSGRRAGALRPGSLKMLVTARCSSAGHVHQGAQRPSTGMPPKPSPLHTRPRWAREQTQPNPPDPWEQEEELVKRFVESVERWVGVGGSQWAGPAAILISSLFPDVPEPTIS